MNALPYFFLIPSILLSVSNSLLLHRSSSWGMRGIGDMLLFNAAVSGVWTLIMATWVAVSHSVHFDRGTVLFGLIYAGILCSFQYFKMRAMATGPVSLTGLIACCAFIPVVIYSRVVYGEIPGVCQIVGMVGIVASLALSLLAPGEGRKPALRWGFFCVLFFAAGVGVGILYREFGRSSCAENINEMFLVASALSAVFFLMLSFTVRNREGSRMPVIPRGAVPFVFLCGLTGCFYIRMNITLSAQIPSAIFFPVFNGSSVFLTALGGLIFFGEKPTRRQRLGLTLGILFLLINGCGDLILNTFLKTGS